MGEGGLHCTADLHVSPALDDSVRAVPILAASGGLPGWSYGVRGHPERGGGGESCQRLPCACGAGCAGTSIFQGAQVFFHGRYQVSPASDIAPLTKPRAPLASGHLTPFFGLNVEEKLCLSPVPPSKPLLGGRLWVGGGQHAGCSLASVLAASMSLIGDGGLFGCPEVPRQQLRQQHWLARICCPGNELPALPAPQGHQQSGAARKKKRKKGNKRKKGKGAGSVLPCRLEIRLLLHQGCDSSRAGDAAVMLGRPSKPPSAT